MSNGLPVVELSGEARWAVAGILRSRGWDAVMDFLPSPNVLVNGLVTVDVHVSNLRAVTRRAQVRWQFAGGSDRLKSESYPYDLLILVCWGEKPAYFVIPGCVMQSTVWAIEVIGPDASRRLGKWQLFYEAWELADYVIAGTLWMRRQNERGM